MKSVRLTTFFSYTCRSMAVALDANIEVGFGPQASIAEAGRRGRDRQSNCSVQGFTFHSLMVLSLVDSSSEAAPE